VRAAEAAISNPLLEDTSMAGARGLLINITGGDDMTLFEVDQAANRIREEVAEDANIIFGSAVDENLNGRVRVSVVATGIDMQTERGAEAPSAGPRLVAVGGGAGAPAPAGVRAAKPLVAAHGAPVAGPVAAGNQATAVAYAEPEADAVPERAEAPAFVAPPRPASSALFTQAAHASAPEPAPAAAPRASIFNIVTGKLRGGRAAAPVEDLPDLRDLRRTEPRMAEPREPAAQVRQTAPEQEAVGLDVPAFLRRQHS
jgi:cell division protein FtsZ